MQNSVRKQQLYDKKIIEVHSTLNIFGSLEILDVQWWPIYIDALPMYYIEVALIEPPLGSTNIGLYSE